MNVRDMIPNIDALQKLTKCYVAEPPTREALDKMAGRLYSVGYRRENPEVFDAICQYGAAELEGQNRRGLFIKGVSSIGKTLGVAMLAAFFKWPLVSADVLEKQFMADQAEFDAAIAARDFFGRPVPLVIDDVGTETFPLVKYGSAYNLMEKVLDFRYREFCRNGARTIITSNLSDEQLRDRYGFRIDERLNEMFDFRTVTGRSLRS